MKRSCLALAGVATLAGLTAADAAGTLVPPLMQPYAVGWAAGGGRGNGTAVPAEDYMPADFMNGEKHRQAALERGIRPEDVRAYLQARSAGHFIPPERGIGTLMDDPKHPYFNNSTQRAIGGPSTVRVAGLEDEAARNLRPWALEAVRRQNALALAGKNTQTRFARCWELGVPNFDEIRHPLYFIQTDDVVVLYTGHWVRHVYMNVPHSKNPPLTWNGESVGRYEGDTLVVDTIGQNDKTFVDGYRTPHTTKIHVVERFRVINGGKGLDTSFTVDDPGAFYKPWGARKPRYVVVNYPLEEMDRVCAAGNEDIFNQGLDPLPKATKPDF